jgi:hypothetical protein
MLGVVVIRAALLSMMLTREQSLQLLPPLCC